MFLVGKLAMKENTLYWLAYSNVNDIAIDLLIKLLH